MCCLVSTSFGQSTPLNQCVKNKWLAAQSDHYVINALFAAGVGDGA